MGGVSAFRLKILAGAMPTWVRADANSNVEQVSRMMLGAANQNPRDSQRHDADLLSRQSLESPSPIPGSFSQTLCLVHSHRRLVDSRGLHRLLPVFGFE